MSYLNPATVGSNPTDVHLGLVAKRPKAAVSDIFRGLASH